MRYTIKTTNSDHALFALTNLINECGNLELKSVSNIQLIKHEHGIAVFKISHLYKYLEPKLSIYLDKFFNNKGVD